MTACRQLGWAKGSLGSSYVFFILPPYLSTSSSMFPSLLECEVQQLMLMLFSSIRCTCLVNQCQRQLKTVWFYGLPHKDNKTYCWLWLTDLVNGSHCSVAHSQSQWHRLNGCCGRRVIRLLRGARGGTSCVGGDITMSSISAFTWSNLLPSAEQNLIAILGCGNCIKQRVDSRVKG